MQIIIQIGKGARTVRVAPVRLHGVVRVTVKWLTALIILPPVAAIYLPATVLAEILTTIAKAADSIGKRFDTFWDSDSNAEVRDGGPVASDSARDAIPPFSAPTGSGDFLKP